MRGDLKQDVKLRGLLQMLVYSRDRGQLRWHICIHNLCNVPSDVFVTFHTGDRGLVTRPLMPSEGGAETGTPK